MDLSETIIANSEQINAEDLLGGPVTARVVGVERGTAEQPVFIHLEGFEGRTYRPAKSVRRLLVAAWGADSSAYVGRSMTIYTDPKVKWAGKEVGGVRISHLSHLNGPVTVALTVARGKREPFTVQPLTIKDESGRDWLKELAEADGDPDLIMTLGKAAVEANASEQIVKVIRTEYQKLTSAG